LIQSSHVVNRWIFLSLLLKIQIIEGGGKTGNVEKNAQFHDHVSHFAEINTKDYFILTNWQFFFWSTRITIR